MGLEDNPFAPASDAPFAGSDAWADPHDLQMLKADRFRRWLGATIDGLLPLLIAFPAGFAMLGASGSNPDPDEMELLFYGAYFAGALPFTFANWYFIVNRGQSLGKMAVGTRIVAEDGSPVDFVKGVILRNWVIAVVNGFCGFAGFIDAILIFGDQKQCGHDMIAKTIVVEANQWNPYEG